jgi:mRNA-degrading endonuclease toxin of MazEF toxin-antitoxin module/predicted transcriptional regulator
MAQIKTGILLDEDLYNKAEHLAQELHLTRSGLYARALQEFIERQVSQRLLDGLNTAYADPLDAEDEALLRGIRRTQRRIADPIGVGQARIRQGELYWADLGEGDLRPAVVLQNDVANHSRLQTVIVCALTSNFARAKAPGNVLLDPSEGRLPRRPLYATCDTCGHHPSSVGGMT